MSINLDDGRWYCFTESKGGDYMELVAGLKRTGQFLEGAPKPYEAQEQPILRSWAERGFTTAMLVKWGIVWDEEIRAMRIPVLTEAGDHLANIWRAPEGVEPKYRYDAGFSKNEVLFGLWRLPNPCQQRIILVEGPLDAVWVQDCGLAGVAVLGSSLSDGQLELLVERSVRQVVLCFDNDAAGVNATYQARGLLRAVGIWVYRVHLPGKYKDIQEVPHEDVEGVIGHAELCINNSVVHPRYGRWVDSEKTGSSDVWRNR
jgi:5S rRNA maturation endonuclease (ribonuclease M5)